MKQLFFTLIASFLFFAAEAQSVCTPDTNIHHTYLSNLPDAVCNVAYDQTLQFRFPSDTSIGPVSVHVDSVKIYNVVGMPYSFKYQCNKKSRTYKTGENGCVTITGNPTDSQNKSYTLQIYDTVWATAFGTPTIITQPGTLAAGKVSFKIDKNSGIFYGSPGTAFDIKQNYPNPFDQNTEIEFNAPAQGHASLMIRNELGQQVRIKQFEAMQGYNVVTISRGQLPAGLYFYTLQSGDNQLTRRMVIKD